MGKGLQPWRSFTPPWGAPAHPFKRQGTQGGSVQTQKPAGRPALHIYAPPSYYLGQVRRTGCQKWRTVTGKTKSLSRAMCAAIKAMNVDDKRARVLLCSTCGYLGPTVVMEAAK